MRLLAQFSLCFALAVGAANYLIGEPYWLQAAALCLGVGTVVALALKRRRKPPPKLCPSAWVGGMTAGFLWMFLWVFFFLTPLRALDNTTLRLSGTVLDWPQESSYGGYSVVVAAELGAGGRTQTLLYLDEQGAGLAPGDRIETVARLTLSNRTSAGKEITYYTAQGILMRGKAYGLLTVETPRQTSSQFLPLLLARALGGGFERTFSSQTAGLISALVMGDKSGISDVDYAGVKRIGLAHALAVSGMHLVFLCGMITAVLGENRRRTTLVTIPCVVFFVLMVGAGPSVVRAGIMIVLVNLAPLFHREADTPTSLGVALMLILLQNPLAFTHVGLQLSYASLVGMSLYSRRIQTGMAAWAAKKLPGDGLPRRGALALWRGISAVLASALGAMLFSTPLSALYFGQVSLLSPISNLLCMWCISLLFSAGLVVGGLGLVLPGVADVCRPGLEALSDYLFGMTALLGRVPLAAIPLESAFYRAWFVFFYLYLALALLVPGRRKLPAFVAVCAAALFCASFLHIRTFFSGQTTVSVLDVGQGQSVLLRNGDSLTLVDCGGSGGANAGDLAADTLRGLGRGKLDVLVLTHFHADHVNGVAQLLRRVDVERLVVPRLDDEWTFEYEIFQTAQEAGTEIIFVEADVVFPLGDGALITIFPPLGSRDINERGLSVLYTVGDFDVLVTGDMGQEVELLLLAYTQLPKVEVLVAGHHGSNGSTSPELLEAINPDLAVVSAGLYNSFGHPHADTVQRLARAGTEIYRTDWMGTVTIHPD